MPTTAPSGASPTNHNRIRRLPRHHSNNHATTSSTGRGELSQSPLMFRVRFMTTTFRARCAPTNQPVPTLISGYLRPGHGRMSATARVVRWQDGVGTPCRWTPPGGG